MPKKSAVRGGAQRNRPRVQKSIELVRPVPERQESEAKKSVEPTAVTTATGTATTDASPAPEVQKESAASVVGTTTATSSEVQKESTADVVRTAPASAAPTASAAPKASTSARLTARRQAALKTPQQRSSANLISAEHYAYVRKDLIFIAILAAIMFSAIIILHFMPGIGS